MAGKKSFEDALIRRGQGVRLTTTTREEEQAESVETQNSENAEVQNSENAQTQEEPKGRAVKVIRGRDGVERINRGITLRPDLLQAIQLLAVQDNRYDYQLIEDALEDYVKKRKNAKS